MKSSSLKSMAVAVGLALGAAVAAAAEAPVNEEQTTATAPAAETSSAKSGEQVVCRREAVIGSMIKKKVCRTVAEDDAVRAQSQETMHEMMERGNGSAGGGG